MQEGSSCQDLEAETCRQLVIALKQLADLVSYSSSICQDLANEEGSVQQKCRKLQHKCEVLGSRLDSIPDAFDSTGLAGQIAAQSVHQIAPLSEQKRGTTAAVPKQSISLEDPAFQTFTEKWQSQKYTARVAGQTRNSTAPRLSPSRATSRSWRLSAPSAPLTSFQNDLGPNNPGVADSYTQATEAKESMHSKLPGKIQKAGSLEQGRLTKDVEMMTAFVQPSQHGLATVTEDEEIMAVPQQSGQSLITARTGSFSEGLRHLTLERNAALPPESNPQQEEPQLSPVAQGTIRHSPSLQKTRGTSVNVNPLYLLIPQSSNQSPRSASAFSPHVVDQHMRTDSAGAVSVAALSAGDESPASKKKSIELDAIIAEGQASWQRNAQAAPQGTPRRPETPQSATAQKYGSFESHAGAHQYSHLADNTHMPNAPVARGSFAGLMTSHPLRFTPLGQAALQHGHLSFARMDFDANIGFHSARSFPSQQSQALRRSSSVRGSASHEGTAYADVLTDSSPERAEGRGQHGVEPRYLDPMPGTPSQMQPGREFPAAASIQLPAHPEVVRIPQHLAPLRISVEPKDLPEAYHRPATRRSLAGSHDGYSPRVSSTSHAPFGRPRTPLLAAEPGAQTPPSSMGWQSYGVQAPDDVFVPPLDNTPLSRHGIEGNTEDGPTFMSGSRPRSPSFPAEIMMLRGPLQHAAHSTSFSAPPAFEAGPAQRPSWGQSRYVLQGDDAQSAGGWHSDAGRAAHSMRSSKLPNPVNLSGSHYKHAPQAAGRRRAFGGSESALPTSRFKPQTAQSSSSAFGEPLQQIQLIASPQPDRWNQGYDRSQGYDSPHKTGYGYTPGPTLQSTKKMGRPASLSMADHQSLKAFRPVPAAPPPDPWERQSRQSWSGVSHLSSLPGSQSLRSSRAGQQESRGSTPPTSPLQHVSPSGTFPRRFGVAPYTTRVLATR